VSTINHTYFTGLRSVGVIDFNSTGEAAMAVVIGGVTYLEADAEDFPNGVWSNGANAGASAASLIDAINDDTRGGKPKVFAYESTVGDSIILVADEEGVVGDLVVTQDGASACTVENMHDGKDGGRKKIAAFNYAVTAQDVLADQCNIPLPFAPEAFIVNVRGATGLIDAATVLATIETGPDRIMIEFAGATDPVAGDLVHGVVFE